MDDTTLTLTMKHTKRLHAKRMHVKRLGTKRPSMHPTRINRCWPVSSGPQL